ncbi:helix-turn-helix transcriptional regulator [Streptomyces sp. NPDC045251]|uniref:helix-turn-helix domain-containing protein n=1 Tax=unclassified Streptomyces TaxID=2593676 RepID=UPI0033FD9032
MSAAFEFDPQALRRIREEHGLSQIKLAAKIGRNATTVNQYERGKTGVSVATLVAIADALGASMDDSTRPPWQPRRLEMAAKAAQTETTADLYACACSQFATADGQTTGCTAKRLFAPGHDAKLKSFLIRMGADGAEVIRTVDGIASPADALTHAQKFAFGHMVIAGVALAGEKARKKAERLEAKAAAKAEGRTARPKQPRKVRAKVGRATYEGRMDSDHFVYEVKGKERRTLKFQAV